MTWKVRGVVGGIAIAVGLATASAASAAVYCVHQGGSCGAGEIDEGANLQTALTLANGSGEDDQVKVGAGTYNGPFTYAGAGGAVQVTGVGTGTILTAGIANGVTVLSVNGAASRVESLHIDVPLGNTTNQNDGLDMEGGTADGVSVLVTGTPTGNIVGVNFSGGTFRNGSVIGPMPAAPPTTHLKGIQANGIFLIADSTVQMDVAMDLFGGGTVQRVDAQGRIGFSFQAENTAGADGTVVVEDSLWQSQPGSDGSFVFGLFPACGTTADLQLTARNLTLVNETSGGTTASSICNGVGRSATVNLSSSIVLGGAQSLRASADTGAIASLNASYSDYDPAKIVTTGPGSATVTQGAGNVNVVPGFVGPADFHLAPGSPLIDIGDPAGLAAGESPTDLGGAPRIAGGGKACEPRRDIGAYEAPAQPAPSSCQPATRAIPVTTASCRGKTATIVGSESADQLSGTPAADVIAALGGNDKISGLAGNDTICGGSGKDTLKGGKGNDKLYGESGKDTLKGGPGQDKLNGGTGKDKQVQ